jgi:hypothetical protein
MQRKLVLELSQVYFRWSLLLSDRAAPALQLHLRFVMIRTLERSAITPHHLNWLVLIALYAIAYYVNHRTISLA